MNQLEIMVKVANEHSYEDWGELMYDTHPHSQIEYTEQAMNEFALQQAIAFKNWCDAGNAYFFDNHEQHTHTTEELYFLFTQNYKSETVS